MKIAILAAAASATLYKVCTDFNQPCAIDFAKLVGTWYTAGANYETCKCNERFYGKPTNGKFPVKMQCIEKSKNEEANQYTARIHDKETIIMVSPNANESVSKALAVLTPGAGLLAQGQTTERFINAWHDSKGKYKYIAINYVSLKMYYIYSREKSISTADAKEIDNYIYRHLSALNTNFFRQRFGKWTDAERKTIWNKDASICKRG